MSSPFLKLFLLGFCLAAVAPSEATLLAPTATLTPESNNYLNESSLLGTPGLFWVVPILSWDQNGPITIEVPVLSGLEGSIAHTVFLTVENLTPDEWTGFSIKVDGPATISPSPPPNIAGTTLPSLGLLEEPDHVIFTASTPSETRSFINFSLDVTSPVASEPVRLTFEPLTEASSVPEPSAGLILAGLLGLGLRSRRLRLNC